ncbi:peptidase domain-containing ABC transporter [Dolichospermum sp. FACHB-1091]|uniref:peptidase domain-containing ABC transporter n=1 Tax=Dolichospermum sp. FACHB-1091 TaxID=2692798 RepID=UPI001680587A|nr:peptidase domain-containing ABC transporter [Dolichospermum sp. FACHB-1091]MBD2443298.1 peptidase domain-containing ABC transporter [Dolichospermum sp. FACHB-1091]
MVSVFSDEQLAKHIREALGDSLSNQIVVDCIKVLEIIEPPTAKQFWQGTTAKPGIYIVLTGKVRLLDSANNLITTLVPGSSFGELTLFPEQEFSNYVARASVNLKIAYLPQKMVKKVMEEFPSVYNCLLNKAQLINTPRSSEIPITQTQKLAKSSNLTQLTIAPLTPTKKRPQSFPIPTVTAGNWWRKFTKRYPFFEQQSAADCGAACLVMIGRYWGKNFSINRLRDLANVNRSGASIRSLSAAAESLGFATRPVKASLDKFTQQPLPAIAHWDGKHYIVVYEITKKQVIIADPAIGQRSLTINQFKAGWTGYALLLEPTASLKKTPEANTPFWQLLDLVKPHFQVLLEVFIASVLIQVFGLVTPLFTQLLLDRVIVQGSALTLNTVGFGLLIFGLFRVAINGLRQYLLDHTANRISVALMVGFIKHTFALPLSFFESRYVGDIVSRVQENQKIQRFLTGEALSIGLDLLTVVIYVGLMFWYSPPMAGMTLAIVPPFVLLTLFATPFLRRISREVFAAGTLENSYLIQSLTGISSIRSMAIEQTVRWRWEELLNNLIKKNFSGQVVSNQLQLVSSTIQSLASTGLLWFGAGLVIQNQLTIGQLVAFNMLLGNIIQPFQRLIILWNQLQEVIVATERINDVLEAEPEEDLEYKPRQDLPRLIGKIRFNNVTFRYHSESEINILENLSFEILPEQTVAVVGRSGSGKTTLSKLILGLYPPTDGRVLIDNQDVTSISLHSLRSQIGVVDQDTFLFGGTIRENISIAHPEASLEEIIEAAQFAGADEFIKRMPMGYETQIGEGGGMLSGGQRQRLAIARALLGNPRLLILDEATSHLDSESERIIQNNLKKILKGRTSIIIAHRLSTVRHADLILVLDRGVLVESGTHDELITKKGHYFYLNQQQLAQTN